MFYETGIVHLSLHMNIYTVTMYLMFYRSEVMTFDPVAGHAHHYVIELACD